MFLGIACSRARDKKKVPRFRRDYLNWGTSVASRRLVRKFRSVNFNRALVTANHDYDDPPLCKSDKDRKPGLAVTESQ